MSRDVVPFRLSRPRNYAEAGLQKAVVTFLRWSLPEDATFMAIPNGGWRQPGEAARMIGEGLRAGAPDVLVVWRGRPIFLELKSLEGVLSAHQRQMRDKLAACGCEVFVCRSLDDVATSLRSAGVTLRGRLETTT